jgi:hypothetical protein
MIQTHSDRIWRPPSKSTNEAIDILPSSLKVKAILISDHVRLALKEKDYENLPFVISLSVVVGRLCCGPDEGASQVPFATSGGR